MRSGSWPSRSSCRSRSSASSRGVITDRLDARRLVIGTQVAQLVTAVALAWIALGGFAQPWMLYTIAFLNGMILVLDVPSRQQLTYRMVGRDVLPNAIALNSSLFNASRIFGPSLAGIILGFAGVGVCFTVNAVSFLAVLLGLLAMRTSEFFPVERFERPSILRGTREGLAYVRRQPRMRIVLCLTLILSTFCFNFNVTLPVLAYTTLHTHAFVFGILSAVFGAGALAGALVAASRGRASAKVMIIGATVFTSSELLLGLDARRGARGRAPLLRRRRLHGLVGELERLDAALCARPSARPHHRHLLLRVQRHRPARRPARRLALRGGRHGGGVRRRGRRRPRGHGGRRAAAARAGADARPLPGAASSIPRDASEPICTRKG